MNSKPEQPISPRVTAAFYFAVYALLFLLFIKYTLSSMNNQHVIPFGLTALFAIPAGVVVGIIFGPSLAKPCPWIKSFGLGMLAALFVLALLTLTLILRSQFITGNTFSQLSHWKDYLVLFGALFASLFLIIGLWLLPLTGLTALYFNKRFFPGLKAIDDLNRKKNQPAVKRDVDNH